MERRVLVVDDEQSIQVLMLNILKGEGYEVAIASDGREALKTFFLWRPELVVLDVMLPQMDGWQVLERIREVSEAPVIMLSALAQEHQVVRGLKSGADDYVTKPFRMGELLARVEVAMRKMKTASAAIEEYRDAMLHMDFVRHQVHLRGDKVDLSPQEFRLLSILTRNAGKVMTSDRLLDQCWGESEGGTESLRVYIGYLRKKLQDNPRHPELIETVREFGYRYCPPTAS